MRTCGVNIVGEGVDTQISVQTEDDLQIVIAQIRKATGLASPSAIEPSKEIDGLKAALKQAVQLAEVAGDWNLDEVEIDGVMVPVGPLGRAWKELIGRADDTTKGAK